MKVYEKIKDIREHILKAKAQNKTVGLVPTMGSLHEGHLSLIRAARAENDLVAVSIFVNPAQFGAGEDFERYPRNLARDCDLAAGAGADVVFAPSPGEMYPGEYFTYVDVESLGETLCGASRPGHFKGVATVVLKLFNILTPDAAYFGQKDAQQLVIIRKMAEDLNLGVKIIGRPIVREADGLALSSRNKYLSPSERRAALSLYRALCAALSAVDSGERDVVKLKNIMREEISAEPLARIDYISVVNSKTLKPSPYISGGELAVLAVFFGETRLIDNMILGV